MFLEPELQPGEYSTVTCFVVLVFRATGGMIRCGFEKKIPRDLS